ncbi:hypothetical protein BH24ACI3_BH24ACI3_07180 [soil metagenome]
MNSLSRYLFILIAVAVFQAGSLTVVGQVPTQRPAAAERGSQTAKGGFRNENEIRDKFNNWRTDDDAKAWLRAMGHDPAAIESVAAAKPHGDKADVVVTIKTSAGEFREGISIKLVSGTNGFNQIDKRWLRQYAAMWKMPPDVVAAMRLYLGEDKPNGTSRRPERMFLNELDLETQAKVIEFFVANKASIIEDLLAGDGLNKAGWFMVALKSADRSQWTLRPMNEVIKFFGEGRVEMTRAGNLKLGRISMQRKGGDGGRETAKMLQFKLNPAMLFEPEKR